MLAGWKKKLLSKAGKEVLIKAVAQAIPAYTMSCFNLPDSFCDDLMGMIRNFWWEKRRKGKLHGLVRRNCVNLSVMEEWDLKI